MNTNRLILIALTIVCGLCMRVTHACLWDRDTLAAEAGGIPGVVDIIVGRFDRWPDEVYAIRLERVAKELGADPARLDLYDDAGVACDRLGRHTEAIEWMARKRAVLDGASGDQSEHEYRYLANLGTFYAHRWLTDGADRDDMADIEAARDLIAEAIELNPDAHFGREQYQLAAIKWIIDAPDDDAEPFDGGLVRWTKDFLFLDPTPVKVYGIDGEVAPEDVIKGLSGLIVLGNAQSSIDIHLGLAVAARSRGDSSVAYLALLRCDELLAEGRGSLSPGLTGIRKVSQAGAVITEVIDVGPRADIERYFDLARSAADERQRTRNEYIRSQISAGKHPDTHADFMNGFKEPRAPKPPGRLFGMSWEQGIILKAVIYLLVMPAIIVSMLWFGIRALIRRSRAKRAVPA